MGPARSRQTRPARAQPPEADYHAWKTAEIALHGRTFTVYSKAGMSTEGGTGVAALLLAGAVEMQPTSRVLDLNCGAGLVGVVAGALAPAGQVVMAAANIIDVEAARRTVAANSLPNVEVHLSSGTSHLRGMTPVDLVTVRLPKGKLPTLQLIWDAFVVLKPGGHLYLAGANDEGIQPALRHMADLFGNVTTIAYRKGYRVGRATKGGSSPTLPEAFAIAYFDHDTFHQFAVEVRGQHYQVRSRPGVFAWDRLDEGTRALIEAMEIERGDNVLDLGCGYGIAGVVAAELTGTGTVTLVDVELAALESARRTVAANGLTNCAVMPSDGAAAVRHLTFDRAITNPPFHAGKATVYDAALQFIQDAASVLRSGGRLYLVANRFIPYEAAMRQAFGNVSVAYASSRYKVLAARRDGKRATSRPGR